MSISNVILLSGRRVTILLNSFKFEFVGKSGVKLNRILWWVKRNNFKLSKSGVNRVLKDLEDEGKIVNVSSGKVGKKRRRGTFLEGCTMDFTSGIDEESRKMDVVTDPSQVYGQEEMVAFIHQEEDYRDYRHKASGTNHSCDPEKEDVDMDEETESCENPSYAF